MNSVFLITADGLSSLYILSASHHKAVSNIGIAGGYNEKLSCKLPLMSATTAR